MVTNCTSDNIHSANNLMAAGYRLYSPRKPWAGATHLYWIKGMFEG